MTERTICHIMDKVLHLESRVICLENKNEQLEEKNAQLEKVQGEFCNLKGKFEELKQFIKGKIDEIFEEDEDQMMEMDGNDNGNTTDSIEILDLEDQNISPETDESESPKNNENFVKIENSFELESTQKTPIKILTPTSAEKSKKADEICDTPVMPKLILSEIKPSPNYSSPLMDQNGLKMAKIDIKREVEIKKEAVQKIQDFYPCLHCPQFFSRSSALGNHMKIHSKRTEFKCTTCPKNFPDLGTLNMHMKGHLGDYKSYECPEPNCKLLKFKTKSQLSAHKVIHQKVKGIKLYKYKCTICSKEFARKDYLKSHNRVHTGETPYNCSICNKSFTYKLSLTRHSKTQHKV